MVNLLLVVLCEMADHKEDMGAVTHQISGADEDVHKTANVKEANVASVALGELTPDQLQVFFLGAHQTDEL